MNIEQAISQSTQKENEGKSLFQQSLENYIEGILGLKVIEFKEGEKYEESQIIATNPSLENSPKFLFSANFYDTTEFNSRENYLTLVEIIGESETLPVGEDLYLNPSNFFANKQKNIWNLLEKKNEDDDLKFIKDLIMEKLKQWSPQYSEENPGNIKTFSIVIDEDIRFRPAFSNTIQVDFKKPGLQTVQIVYKELSKETIEKNVDELCSVIGQYLVKEIVLDDNNISQLYNFLKSNNFWINIVTDSLMTTKQETVKIVTDFVIGEYDSYKQIEVSIFYNKKEKQFELCLNYLLQVFNTKCNTVEEVIEQINKYISLVK